jgi:hypothetical protein
VILQKGSLGKVAYKLITGAEAQEKKIQIVKIDENSLVKCKDMLNSWKKTVDTPKVKSLRIIIDLCAQLKNEDPRTTVFGIAEFVKKNIDGVKFIEYFDSKINAFAIVSVSHVIETEGNFTPQKMNDPVSDRPTDQSELFTFLDSPRSTGTDPFLMKNGHGIVTVNPLLNTADDFLQAVMRERKFLDDNGQTVDVLIPSKVSDATIGVNVNMPLLFSRLIKNTSGSCSRQHLQSIFFELQEAGKRSIEKFLISNQDSAYENDDNHVSLLTEESFNPDNYITRRTFQGAKNLLKKQLKNVVTNVNSLYDGKQSYEARDEILCKFDDRIGEIKKDMKILSFPDEGALEFGHDEHVEVEQEVEILQNVNAVQEISFETDMSYDFMNDATYFVAKRFEKIPDIDTPVAAHIATRRWESSRIQALIFKDQERSKITDFDEYESARNVFIDKLNGNFFATENFLKTSIGQKSVFSPSQKSVEYMLMSWNSKFPLRNKCHFVSLQEAESIRKLIESKKLKDCYLCTLDGVKVAHGCEISGEENKKFLSKALCVAHVFNADTNWLKRNRELTKELFDELNNGFEDRKNNMESVVNFMVLRSSDKKQVRNECEKSSLLSEGYFADTYELSLAEKGLTKRSPKYMIEGSISKANSVSRRKSASKVKRIHNGHSAHSGKSIYSYSVSSEKGISRNNGINHGNGAFEGNGIKKRKNTVSEKMYIK